MEVGQKNKNPAQQYRHKIKIRASAAMEKENRARAFYFQGPYADFFLKKKLSHKL